VEDQELRPAQLKNFEMSWTKKICVGRRGCVAIMGDLDASISALQLEDDAEH
jgi:hypothetical protein